MTTDLSDLLGTETDQPQKPKRKVGRPTREESLAKAMKLQEPIPHYSTFRQPVGVTFLAKVVGRQPRQIEKRLEKCPVAHWGTHKGGQVPMYDFLSAMAYLIPPRGNIEDWFAQQNAASLPPYVNKMWWDSAHQRNRVMLSSNDLWHSDDVALVLGRVAMSIRQEVKMWVEDLPEKELLNDAQYNALIDAGNRLVDGIRETLSITPGETCPMSQQIRSELEASGTIPDADRADDEGFFDE